MITPERVKELREHFKNDCDGMCDRPTEMFDTIEKLWRVAEAAKRCRDSNYQKCRELHNTLAELEQASLEEGK